MQTIIEHWIFLYMWVFLITSVMLFMEINIARRIATLTNTTKTPTWNCANITAVLAFAIVPPVGWALTWFVRRHRVSAEKALVE